MMMQEKLRRPGLFLLCLLASHVAAGEWRGGAGIAPRLIYTDNVCLRNTDKRSELINTVTPSVFLQGAGSKASIDLAASVQWNDLSDETLEESGCQVRDLGSNRQQFAPRLRANGNLTAIDNWLYLNANAGAYQERIDPFRAGGDDGLNRTGNTNTVYRYGISPYINHRFKDLANLSVRYDWKDQQSSEDIVGDSERQSVSASLVSPGQSLLIWGVEGQYSETTFTETTGRPTGEDNVLSWAQARLGYRLSREWQIFGVAGRDFNDYSVNRRQDIDGEYWNANAVWTPTARTRVAVGYGDRFFGSTPSVSISQEHKRHLFTLSYAKLITFDIDIREPDEGPIFEDEFGRPIDPIGDDPFSPDASNPSTLTNSPIIEERLSLAYALRGRRTTYRVSGNLSNQERTEDGLESEFRRVTLGLNRALSRATYLDAQLNWRKGNSGRGVNVFQDDLEEVRFAISLNHKLAENLRLGLSYQYNERKSDIALDEYTENRVVLSLGYSI